MYALDELKIYKFTITKRKQLNHTLTHTSIEHKTKCQICQQNHGILQCSTFMSSTPILVDRLLLVKIKNLLYNFLCLLHGSTQCTFNQ